MRTDNNSGVKIIPSEAEVLKLEARYEAVTADISQELKELELEEEKALPATTNLSDNYGNYVKNII